MSAILDPDCAAEKHRNCDGGSWDNDTDKPTTCPCPCHFDNDLEELAR